jgi:hypothetical protein
MASAKLRQGQIPNGEDNGLLFSPTDNGEVTTPPEVSQIRPPQPWSWQQGVSWQVCTNAHSCTTLVVVTWMTAAGFLLMKTGG